MIRNNETFSEVLENLLNNYDFNELQKLKETNLNQYHNTLEQILFELAKLKKKNNSLKNMG